MRKLRSILALAAIVIAITCTSAAAQQFFEGNEVVSNEVLVQYRPADRATGLARSVAMHDIGQVAPIGQNGALRLRSRTRSVEEMVRELRRNPAVEYVEPNFVFRLSGRAPNDPSFREQWGLYNSGQAVLGIWGKAGADIKATAAWDVSTGDGGSASAVVAVLDSGVDYRHPDLSANLWRAASAFSVTVGGFTVTCPANVVGFNAVSNTCDPADDNGHGTQVAGIIGARGNNGSGITGVAWSTRMMSLKCLDRNGVGTTASIVNAIDFAIGAKRYFGAFTNVRVLSMSFGSYAYSQVFYDAILRARANDMLVVAAAGNDNVNNDVYPVYPASYNTTNIISVGATTSTDQLAAFSNYGNRVHLAAPGQAIFSTAPSAGYSYSDGTSFAAPFVSGAAMVVLSACNADTSRLRDALVHSADRPSWPASMPMGGGRLNVLRSIYHCRPPLPTNVPVQIVAVHSGKCLDVTNGAWWAGARLQQWDCNGLPQQRFWLSPSFLSGKQAVQTAAGKWLDIAGGATTNGAPVEQSDNLFHLTAGWSLEPYARDEYRIVNRQTGKVLDVTGGSAAVGNGVPVQQWDFLGGANQIWRIVPAQGPTPNGVYQLVATHSGKCLDQPVNSSANGARLQQVTCNSWANQRFWITALPGAGQYNILGFGGKALDVRDGSTQNGAAIQNWEYLHGSNQHWRLKPVGDGSYTIESVNSGKVLDVSGGPTAVQDGTLIQQWDFVGGANQKWLLRPAP